MGELMCTMFPSQSQASLNSIVNGRVDILAFLLKHLLLTLTDFYPRRSSHQILIIKSISRELHHECDE